MAEAIGTLVKRLRAHRGLTQGQLAEYAKVPRSWLSVVELGRIETPDRDRLEQIASVLRVEPQLLYGAAGYRVSPVSVKDMPAASAAEALGWAVIRAIQAMPQERRQALFDLVQPEAPAPDPLQERINRRLASWAQRWGELSEEEQEEVWAAVEERRRTKDSEATAREANQNAHDR